MDYFIFNQYTDNPYTNNSNCSELDNSVSENEKKAVAKIKAAQSIEEIVEIISEELANNIISQIKG